MIGGRKNDNPVFRLNLRIRVGDKGLAVSQHGANADAVGKTEVFEAFTDDGGGFKRFGFNHFSGTVLYRMHTSDAAAADMLQDPRHGDGARIDLGFNAQ